MTRRLALGIGLFVLCSVFGQAQNTRVDGVVYRASGFPAAGAFIAVCTQPATIGTSVAACTPLASLCSSATDVVCTSPNPVTADGLGNYNFYIKPGKYSYQFYGSGLTTRLQVDQTISPALDTNNSFTGSNTFKTLNNQLYASQWCGGSTDLGVCMNNAVASSANPQLLIVDSLSPTTFSTSPNIPIGWKVRFSPGTYTLATTLLINHHGTVWDFAGAQFNYNQDAGNAAIFVGKNLTGNATCNGTTTVTWNSGSLFTTLDTGDQFMINAGTYNVASVTNSTTLVLTSTCGAVSNSAFGTYMVTTTDLGTYWNSMGLRDFSINYTGANTQNNIGLQIDWATDVLIENVAIGNFSKGTGFKGIGIQIAQVVNAKINNNKFGVVLDGATRGGVLVASNANSFYSTSISGGCAQSAAGSAIIIQGQSFGNTFPNVDIEGNVCTTAVIIQGGAFVNTIGPGGDIERNGDGTGASSDITITAANNTVDGIRFSSSTLNVPASGVLFSGSGTQGTLKNSYWTSTAAYTNAYQFQSGTTATGSAVNNSPAAFGVANPAHVEDQSGNYTTNNLNIGNQCWGANAFHTALPAGTCIFPNATNIYWASQANNAIVPAFNLNASNVWVWDPNGQSTLEYGRTLSTANPEAQIIGTGNVTTAGTAVTNGTSQAQTNITVTGAAVGQSCVANVNGALPATWQTGIQYECDVVSSNTVTVYLKNPTAGSITPAATQVNVRVMQ